MKKILFLLVLLMTVGTATATIKNVKYASFGTPGGGASYDAGTYTYTWTASTGNLMNCFTFENGELANYKTLKFTLSSLVDGPVRAGYYVGSSFTEFGNGYYSAGTKTVDLTALGIDLSTVTKIAFGGRSNGGSCVIKWNEMYLENDDDAVLTALIGSVAGNASYNVPNYGWTSAGSNNLMDVFSGAAGDFSKYADGVLQFNITLDDNTNAVRIGYHQGSTFTRFGNGFYSSGTKIVDLSSKSSSAAGATTIKFGAMSAKNSATSGSVVIRPDEMFLVRSEAYNRSFVAGQKSTVWLPFALNAEEVAAAGTFYELTAADGSSLTFTEVATTEAYKPYVFVAKTSGTPFSDMKSKKIVAPKVCSYTIGDYTFQGTMKDMKAPSGAYGYNSANGAFSKATSDDVTIGVFRAYITASGAAAARELQCAFGNETTGISEMATRRNGQNENFYDLNGRKLSGKPMAKGLYIMNGKKYIVK